MARLDNIADAIKYVDSFQRRGYVQMNRNYTLTKKEKDSMYAFVFACKSFCYDRGISVSDPAEEIETDFIPEKLGQAKRMVKEFIQKEAYFLAQYDARCFEGWDLISSSIYSYVSNNCNK